MLAVPPVHPAEKRRGHLGLCLVRDTVAEAGGRVSITSSPGVGTCVEVRLPVR